MENSANLRTERLELVCATRPMLEAALDSREALGAALGARVPDTWPPEFLDDDALRWTIARLAAEAEPSGWWMYFALLLEGQQRTLVGGVGYKGPPSDSGVVEVGYGIVSDRRLRGFATEATTALVARAFGRANVRLVIAETLPELAGSIGVLEKCGFVFAGSGSEPGVIRYELARPSAGVDSRERTE